jgi:hypothetical protein
MDTGHGRGADVLDDRDHLHVVARFRAPCPGCGDVLLDARAVVLLVGGSSGESYCFECPRCANQVTIGASPPTAELLWVAGAAVAADARSLLTGR